MEEKKVSKSVLKRLPGYLAYLKNMPENAPTHISATALANALGMGEVQVRKDLAMVSDGGRPKIGYLRETLIDDIEQFLGYDNTTDAVLIGAGKLGQALMGYSGFDEYGLNILAAFDASPKAEKTEEGKPIYHISQLTHFCRTHKVLMGIITVPAEAAQQVADQLNTTGLYSVVRNPLYVGNFLMWLGIAMLTMNLWFIISFILLFWVYYERIIFAEEQFLTKKFGSVYTDWADKTPCFIPRLKGYVAPKLPFSWKKVIKKEKNGLLALLLVFWMMDVIGDLVSGVTPRIGVLAIASMAMLVIYLILKYIKHKTTLLDEEGR